jgi:hypothetical protein
MPAKLKVRPQVRSIRVNLRLRSLCPRGLDKSSSYRAAPFRQTRTRDQKRETPPDSKVSFFGADLYARMPTLNLLRFLILPAVMLALLAGTASAKPDAKTGITFVLKYGTPAFTPELKTAFQQRLAEELYGKESRFVRGQDYVLTYQPLLINRGSRAARYWAGAFGDGKGSCAFRIEIKEAKTNRLIAQVQADGDRTSGVMGGSFEGAVREAADNAADIRGPDGAVNEAQSLVAIAD